MGDLFDIYVHHLTDGHQEKIAEVFPSTLLAVEEIEAVFTAPISILGEVEVALDVLILRLKIETEVMMPCAICNQNVGIKISISDCCHTEVLKALKEGVFNFKEVVREEVLLALPLTVECGGGNCPERAILAKYFSNESTITTKK